MNIITRWRVHRLERKLADHLTQMDEKWLTADNKAEGMSWYWAWETQKLYLEGQIRILATIEFDKATADVVELKKRFPWIGYDLQIKREPGAVGLPC